MDKGKKMHKFIALTIAFTIVACVMGQGNFGANPGQPALSQAGAPAPLRFSQYSTGYNQGYNSGTGYGQTGYGQTGYSTNQQYNPQASGSYGQYGTTTPGYNNRQYNQPYYNSVAKASGFMAAVSTLALLVL
ncbi:hypothetical protein WR25_13159 [Diploscapter pachys]|uniref:Uncharacterized protein n=1 Tax=Diploscapter pachys TaxID=2018661 RepID=A0A2A2LQ04_9BILA|nr:hypothetical protein WR25_13159 [Diploscapter pachys]